MESGIITRLVLGFLAVVLISATGIVLRRMGKPYNEIVFTIHKLLAIAFIVFFIMNSMVLKGLSSNQSLIILLYGLLIVSLAGLLISGGALSLDKKSSIMVPVHVISTVVLTLTILSSLLIKWK